MARKRAIASLVQSVPDFLSILGLLFFQLISVAVLCVFAWMGVQQVIKAYEHFYDLAPKEKAHDSAIKEKRRAQLKHGEAGAPAGNPSAPAASPAPPAQEKSADAHASESDAPASGGHEHRSEKPGAAKPASAEPAKESLKEPAKESANTVSGKSAPDEDQAGARCGCSAEGPPPPIAEGPMTHDEECKAKAVHAAFQALEFFLLAPLFFLLLRSLSQYITDLMMREVAHVDNPASENFGKASSAESEVGKESLLEAKSLSVGLLFAIVATHMVGKLVGGAYRELSVLGDWGEVITGLSLLLLLGATYLFLVRITHSSHQT
jgi:hypothetical protein